MTPSNNSDAACVELQSSSRNGDAAGVSRILSAHIFSRKQCSEALAEAAYLGHAECVRLLAPLSDPQGSLRLAAMGGHVECAKLLIPFCDPKAANATALRLAAMEGHVECVKLLAAFCDPVEQDSSNALYFAALSGHAQCVGFLIRRSPAFSRSNEIFLAALSGGHVEVAALLLEARPSLFDEIDPFDSWSRANALGHVDLATFLSAAIDRQALLKAVPLGPVDSDPRLGIRL